MRILPPQVFIENFGKIYDFYFWLKWGLVFGLFVLEYYGVTSRIQRSIALTLLLMGLVILFLGSTGLFIFQLLMFWLVFKLCFWTSSKISSSLGKVILLTLLFFSISVFIIFYFYQQISYFLEGMSELSMHVEGMTSELDYVINMCYGG